MPSTKKLKGPFDALGGQWGNIIARQRGDSQSDYLAIAKPRAKLDPIAKAALDALPAKVSQLISRRAQKAGPPAQKAGSRAQKAGSRAQTPAPTPQDVERDLRKLILKHGVASEVKRVSERLNARRMSDGRRWVLAATYVQLLKGLFDQVEDENPDAVGPALTEQMKDSIGVVDRVLLDLEADEGPIDVFADLIIRAVMQRKGIGDSDVLRKLVSQQVRVAI